MRRSRFYLAFRSDEPALGGWLDPRRKCQRLELLDAVVSLCLFLCFCFTPHASFVEGFSINGGGLRETGSSRGNSNGVGGVRDRVNVLHGDGSSLTRGRCAVTGVADTVGSGRLDFDPAFVRALVAAASASTARISADSSTGSSSASRIPVVCRKRPGATYPRELAAELHADIAGCDTFGERVAADGAVDGSAVGAVAAESHRTRFGGMLDGLR